MLHILKKIKKMTVGQLKELDEKLDAIKRNKQRLWQELNEDFPSTGILSSPPILDVDDIEAALTYCLFHFKGGMLESLGYEECPCKCYCISCEIIPENEIGKRMQSLAQDMTEKNVFDEFMDKYVKKEKDGQQTS